MKKRQKLRSGIILFSFFLFPAIFYYLSPVVIIRATLNGVVNGSFIVFVLLFISSLVLGRAYCGWVCPAGGCQEAIFLARDSKIKRGKLLKWVIWIPWIASIIYLAINAGGYKKIDFLYETTYGFSISNLQSSIVYFLVLLVLIVLPSFIFGKRSFCHHLCWMAEFMIIGRKIRNLFGWSSLKIIADKEKCDHCHTCINNCPMSLPVEVMVNDNKMENSDCILCGTCVDGCEYEAIKFSIS
ncbi:MAG: 4Fe-4S binding protein [Desulfobacterales bacterium]|nr:4Fe-4S binding protein [Desulfobacterales bacterium]MCP4161427.1 4Fe-4S binding protein [Deltaproteobacteria bacterium]